MDSFRNLEILAEKCLLRLLGAYDLQPEPTNNKDLSELGRKYGIKFITSDNITCKDLTYETPSKAQLTRIADQLISEFSRYPVEVIQKTRIEQIILCRNLAINSKHAAGTLKVGFPYVDTIFVDIGCFNQIDNFGPRTFHHEVFHAIDFRDSLLGYIDSDWRQLQGLNYMYEIDRAVQLHWHLGKSPEIGFARQFDDPYDRLSVERSNTPGFVSEYAKYSVAEDKAELFSHLMTSYKEVMKRLQWDNPLKYKVAHMKKLLLSFSEQLNEHFWQQTENFKG